MSHALHESRSAGPAGRILRTPYLWLAGLCLCLGILAGCTSLPTNAPRTPSVAASDTADTRLGKVLAPRLAGMPGKSLFYPLNNGPEALAARLALARAAERTIDIQTYIFDADQTGTVVMGDLIDAADRGVRVRLLLDDIHTKGEDKIWAALDSHPNIEIRLFNPFANRGARWLNFALDFRRLDRRMHNKAMTAENQIALVGGRNFGDEYFSARSDVDFSDFDVMIAGPVVPEVSRVFDEYWNSEQSYPVVALIPEGPDAPAGMRRLRSGIAQKADAAKASPYARELLESGLAKGIESGHVPSYSGRAIVIADKADKVEQAPDDESTHAVPKLRKVLEQAEREMLLVSPYFVPDDRGEAWLIAMAGRGVKIRVLTNSFAATDVKAVHAGYAPHREALLKAGIELYELKPSAYAELAHHTRRTSLASSRASLHAKSYMADRHLLFVGSMNLDPRSHKLNTEMGVVLDSAALCERLMANMDKTLPDVAYKVELATDADGKTHLTWTSREAGKLTTYDTEPGMGFFDHLGQGFLRLLPVESEL